MCTSMQPCIARCSPARRCCRRLVASLFYRRQIAPQRERMHRTFGQVQLTTTARLNECSDAICVNRKIVDLVRKRPSCDDDNGRTFNVVAMHSK